MDLYTVPSDVLFRNFAILDGGSSQSSRLLLIQSRRKIDVLVTSPLIGAYFSISIDDETLLQGHASLTFSLSPGTPLKIKILFSKYQIPGSIDCVQDNLCILPLGQETTALVVPLRAVRGSLDPAGGEILKAKLAKLPFSPSNQGLETATVEWLKQMNASHKRSWKLPSDSMDEAKIDLTPGGVVGGLPPNNPSVKATVPSLPPESFTQFLHEAGEDSKPAPVVISKVFASGGERIGVAVFGSITPSLSPNLAMLDDEQDDGQLGPTAYLLDDGRCYDARGMDVTEAVSSSSHMWLILDCSRADGISIVSKGGLREDKKFIAKETPNSSWPGLVKSTSVKSSLQDDGLSKDEALAAAMKEVGLSCLPLPAKNGITPPQAIDMRLRPKSGGKLLLALNASSNALTPISAKPPPTAVRGGEGDSEMDLEAEFEARISRNIEAGMNAASSRTSPAKSGVSLAPLLQGGGGRPRSVSSNLGGSQAARRSVVKKPSESDQVGYGEEEDVDVRLQSHIVAESSRASGSALASKLPAKKPPPPPSSSRTTKRPIAQPPEEKAQQDAWDAL